jgi:hypothetical protein
MHVQRNDFPSAVGTNGKFYHAGLMSELINWLCSGPDLCARVNDVYIQAVAKREYGPQRYKPSPDFRPEIARNKKGRRQ